MEPTAQKGTVGSIIFLFLVPILLLMLPMPCLVFGGHMIWLTTLKNPFSSLHGSNKIDLEITAEHIVQASRNTC